VAMYATVPDPVLGERDSPKEDKGKNSEGVSHFVGGGKGAPSRGSGPGHLLGRLPPAKGHRHQGFAVGAYSIPKKSAYTEAI